MPAAGGWFVCKIVSAGSDESGNAHVRLTDLASASQFGNRWFNAVAISKREMLATALTAIATGLNVDARLESTDENSTLDRLYIKG